MEETQKPKLLQELPEVDIVVTMGCGVQCPYLPCRERQDWGLEDPTGESDDAFYRVMDQIEEKIQKLKQQIQIK